MLLVYIDQAIEHCNPPIKTPRTIKEAQEIVNAWDYEQYWRPVVEIKELKIPDSMPFKPKAGWRQGVFKVRWDGLLELVDESYDTGE
jgi:hypothetical protein